MTMSNEFNRSSGTNYGSFVGRWSRLVVAEFVRGLVSLRGATWIDVGCGTGELTCAILAIASPSRILSWILEGYSAHARIHQ
jgi:hypothetical protein